MSIHRFYLPAAECSAVVLTLAGREAHHALHVLRVREGEEVAVTDGAGQEYFCQVEERGRGSLRLGVLRQRTVPRIPWQVTLLQAIPRGKLFEAIVQKATELGVARIVPLVTERVVSHPDQEQLGHKVDKWEQVAIEAIKQCGSPWLPRIEAPCTLSTWLGRGESKADDLSLVASLQPESHHPRHWFEDYRARHQQMPRSVSVWVGPEGDFTAAEYATVQAGGACPITLGPLVLRCETAAIYCLSVVSCELQAEWGPGLDTLMQGSPATTGV